MHNKALLLSAESAETSPYPGYYKATLTAGSWSGRYSHFERDGVMTTTFYGYAEGVAGSLEPSYGNKTLYVLETGFGATAVTASDFYVDPEEMAEWRGVTVEDIISSGENHVKTGFGGANVFGLAWWDFVLSRERITVYVKPVEYQTNNPVVKVGCLGKGVTDLPEFGANSGDVFYTVSDLADAAVYNNETSIGKLVSLYEIKRDSSFSDEPVPKDETGLRYKFIDDSGSTVHPFDYYQRFGFTRLDTYKTVMVHNTSYIATGLFSAKDIGKEVEVKVHLLNEGESIIVNKHPDYFILDKEQAKKGEKVTVTCIVNDGSTHPFVVEGIETNTQYFYGVLYLGESTTFEMPGDDVRVRHSSYQNQ